MAKEIVEIPTERLLPNPYQPRKQFSSEEMLGLADSIQQNGVLQPLLARRINNSDYYELIAGERRLRASILANLQTVPCIVLDCDYQDSAVISILENIQRANLNFFEEALAIAHLHEHFGLTQQEIGKKLGKSQSALSNKLRLLRLPADVLYRERRADGAPRPGTAESGRPGSHVDGAKGSHRPPPECRTDRKHDRAPAGRRCAGGQASPQGGAPVSGCAYLCQYCEQGHCHDASQRY